MQVQKEAASVEVLTDRATGTEEATWDPTGCTESLFPVHRLEPTEGILGNAPPLQEPGEAMV